MSVLSGWGVHASVRNSVLAAVFCVLPVALGGDRAMAIFACGTFDGKFQCKATPGAAPIGNAGCDRQRESRRAASGPAGWHLAKHDKHPSSSGGAGNANQGGQGGGRGWGWGKKEETVNPGEHSCPPGYRVLAVPGKYGYCEPPEGTAEAVSTGCQHGMVGTPPNCHCPTNSELLGGNCVHYTATCHSGLAAHANPQACPGAEEKLACKMRQGGLKDCCCLTYEKM